jgi:hypothetical protein
VERFRPVARLRDIVGSAPIGVYVQEVFASYWAVYFLRDQPITLLTKPLYLGMPHVQPFLARAPSIPPESIRYLLTDAADPGPVIARDEGWTLVWGVGPYSLWDTHARGWAVASSVTTPNGLERLGGQPFFWMGNGPTHVDIAANRPGTARVAADFRVGPNLPAGTTVLHVRVADMRGVDRVESIVPGQGTICLPISPGTSTWQLSSLDAAIASPPGSADLRPRLIGITAPVLRWNPSSSGSAVGCGQ